MTLNMICNKVISSINDENSEFILIDIYSKLCHIYKWYLKSSIMADEFPTEFDVVVIGTGKEDCWICVEF